MIKVRTRLDTLAIVAAVVTLPAFYGTSAVRVLLFDAPAHRQNRRQVGGTGDEGNFHVLLPRSHLDDAFRLQVEGDAPLE